MSNCSMKIFTMFLAAASLALVASGADSAVAQLETLPDFKIEHVLKADPKVNGSFICLAKDNKGRLLLGGQNGQPVTRITLKDGQLEKQENLKLPISETMGLLYAFDCLYVNGNGTNDKGKRVFGLFRCRDTKGTDFYDSIECLHEWKGGGGEHGAHGIVLGPDKKLYVVCGNFVGQPDNLLPSSPHRNYADDLVLPRAEDGNGFGAGNKPPGGSIFRFDPDGKNVELFASGQRNTYDIAFNTDGELFGFDSDMEWDWGMPWYRPIRVYHAVSGADQGFREGTGKWPEYYSDSLPAAVNVGIGCPTGVVFGANAKFPAKYQKAFYVLDWTYGRLIAVHLKPFGASYTATWENFVATLGLHGGVKTPLNLTDVIIGDDGAMYFTTGGRNTQANLYRVSYVGKEPVTPADLHDADGADARALRHRIEAFHGKQDPAAVDAAWPNLASADRWIRYAARLAIESQPLEQWKSRALAEKQPAAALTALLSLSRLGKSDTQPDVLKALAQFPLANLDEEQQLEKLRVLEVNLTRQGKPSGELATQLIAELSPLYPAKTEFLNRELCQLMLALDAPGAVAKTLGLLEAATNQEEQLTYVLHLRTIKAGWTAELRTKYFSWWGSARAKQHPDYVLKWFEDAGRPYGDGSSFPKFLANFHRDAKATLNADELEALHDVLALVHAPPAKSTQAAKAPKVRKLVKEWQMTDLQPLLGLVGKGRSFEVGKEVFESAQCLACHRFGNLGGSVGPDLTAVSSRFARRDILESIIEPSKVISEQFQNTIVKTKSGRAIEGRIVEENDEKIVLQPNQLLPEKIEVKKADVAARVASKLSPMPENLVNNFSKEEILDLLAYIESTGRRDHGNFEDPSKLADVTAKVAASVKDNKLTLTAGNELFGDPAEGEVKAFRIEYTIGSETLTKSYAEGGAVEISAPADKKLVVKRAVYGVLPAN